MFVIQIIPNFDVKGKQENAWSSLEVDIEVIDGVRVIYLLMNKMIRINGTGNVQLYITI